MQEWRNRLSWVMLVRDERPGMSVHLQVRRTPHASFLDSVPDERLRRSVITLGLAFLLGLTIYVGVRWQLQSLAGYFTAVVVALGIWASAFTLRQTYTAILPLLLGALASFLLALVGLRSALRARQDDHGHPGYWIVGVCLVVTPVLVIVVRWLR